MFKSVFYNFYKPFFKLSTLAFVGFLFFSFNAYSLDLLHKIGLGYQNINGPAVSTRYYFKPRLAVTLSTGFTTKQDHSNFFLEAKIHKVLFEERYLKFFTAVSLALISEKMNTQSVVSKNNGFKIQGGIGAEFFFVNLPSLGFSFETGLSLQSKSGSIQIETVAYAPFTAGVYFYF